MTGERGSKPWVKPVVLSLLVALCLVIVAAAMPKTFPFLRGSGAGEVDLGDAATAIDYLLLVVVIVGLGLALFARVRLVGGTGVAARKRRPVWAQLLTFAVIMLIVWAWVELREDAGGIGGDRSNRSVSEERRPADDDGSPGGAALLVTAALVTGALAAAGGLYRLRQRGEEEVSPEVAAEELAGLIDARLESLGRAVDPGAAVIDCYIAMERALERAGTPRRPSDAPFEFIERALLRFEVAPASADRLTTMFEQARFSRHETTEAMRRDAVAALEDVRDQLKAEA